MGLVDDLNRLSELHESGQLSDEEFEDAKTKLIRQSTGYTPPGAAAPTSVGATAGGPATSTPFDPALTPPEIDPGPAVAGGLVGGVTGGFAGPTTVPTSPGSATPGTVPSSAPVPPAPGTPLVPGGSVPPTTTVHGAGPGTVITSGLGTGGVSLGALPPTGRLRTRAMGLTQPGAVEPKRTSTGTFVASLGCLTIVILFVSLMIATAGVALFPGMARFTAPFLCKAPFEHSYVDITQSNPRPGETYISWELQCYNDRGTVDAPSEFAVMGLLFVEAVVVLSAITAVLIVIGRLRHRRKRAKAEDTLRPAPPAGSLDDLSGGGLGGGPIINPPS